MTTTRKNLLFAALFLAPNFLGFAFFTLGPVLLSFAGSFTTWSLRPTTPLHFIGLANYKALFADRNFYFYLYNTLYLMLAIPVSISGSLALAIYLDGKLAFKTPRAGLRLGIISVLLSLICAVGLWLAGWRNMAVLIAAIGSISILGFKFGSVSYRSFLYLPSFTAGAGTILLWSQLYNPNFGLINQTIAGFYHFFGLNWSAPGWLTNTRSLLGFLPLPEYFNNGGFGLGAREAIMIMGIWGGVGGNNMLLYLAALSNISPELNEAASIDGASPWRQFRHIIWPQLAPTTFFHRGRLCDRRFAGWLRAGTLDDERRPGRNHHYPELLYLHPGIPAVGPRVWVGGGMGVVRAHFYRDRAQLEIRQQGSGMIATFLKNLGLIFIAVAMVLPFLWMTGASVKPHSEVERPGMLPEKWQPENYRVVLRQTPDRFSGKFLDLAFPRWYLNSVLVAAWVTALQVMTSAMAAYAFSRIEWPGRDKIFLLYLSTMMVPGLVLMLPNYQIMVSLHLVNTYRGLILPAAFSAFGTFLMRQFMLGIPKTYDEAASIDGANHLQMFLDVILPLARPGMVTLTILTFMGNYQSFFWPLVMVKDDYLRTIPVGLLSFSTQYGQQTELLMAATLMSIVPLIVVFVVMQKQLVAGLQLGGVKG